VHVITCNHILRRSVSRRMEQFSSRHSAAFREHRGGSDPAVFIHVNVAIADVNIAMQTIAYGRVSAKFTRKRRARVQRAMIQHDDVINASPPESRRLFSCRESEWPASIVTHTDAHFARVPTRSASDRTREDARAPPRDACHSAISSFTSISR